MSVERPDTDSLKPRAAERRYVPIAVKIRRPGEAWSSSRVSDVSVTGFRLQTFMRLHVGDDLWVMFPGFEGRRARVFWTQAHEAGCAFEAPLHTAILDHLVRQHRAAG